MDEDEAAFFSRPKRKVSTLQASPAKGHAGLAQIETLTDTDEDSDTPSEQALRKTSTVAKAAKNDARTPTKEKPSTTNKFICIDSSSDSENGNELPTTKNKRARRSTSRTTGRETRRTRERSDSLTPPPQLSPRGLRQGQNLVQNVFTRNRPAAATDLSSTSILPIVPDEAELLFEEQMRAKEPLLERSASSLNDARGSISRQTSVVDPAPSDTLEIIIRGVYVDLPSTRAIIKEIKLWETPRMLRIRLNMKLSIAKIGFCKEAGMCSVENGVKVVKPEDERNMMNIMLVHNNIRIFDHSTPHDLGISAGDQPFFEAHTKAGWDYLEAHPEIRARADTSTATANGPHQNGNGTAAKTTDGVNGAGGADEPYIKITLRAKNGTELKVRVRPSTKITSIIAGFRSKHAIPDAASVALRFEGDVLEGTMGETDVEDGDVIDVNIA